MKLGFLTLLMLTGCGNVDPEPVQVEMEQLPEITQPAELERQREELAAMAREQRIRDEQERVDRVRQANELDRLERLAQQNRALSDPDLVPVCDSDLDLANLRRENLEPYSRDTRMCVPIGSEKTGVVYMTRCPPCR